MACAVELPESLESYAKRLAETIDMTSSFVIGGVSLGGMIAQQIGLTFNPKPFC